ncbi:MAG: hypothetical protein IT221_11860 [Fluviicola sp.]|nr:hypothetical protein [Fluviicola sp.]
MSAIFVCSKVSFSQNDWLELQPGAERLSYDEKTGIERLTGNINFTYQGNIMYCDSAHYKPKTKEVWAYGNVHLNKADTLNLFCDSLYYNGKTRKAKLWGNVRLRDREYKVTTDTLEYDAKRAQAIYRYGGKIENSTSSEVLTSQFGYFYPNTEESFFKGNVVYKSPELKMTTDTLQYNYLKHRVYFYGPTNITDKKTKLYCQKGWFNVQTEEGVLQSNARIDQTPRIIEGDSLYYAPKSKLAIGKGNVSVIDTVQKIRLQGGYLIADELKRSDVVYDFPLVTMMKSKDTLYLRADTLVHFRDSLNKTIRITGNDDVRIFRNKIQGRADTLDYNKLNGTMDLWGKPFFWSYNSEMSGDSIRVFIKDDTLIEKAHLRYNAFCVNELDSGKFYNQLAGKEMWSYFKNNELVRSEVLGNARTVFFPEEEKKEDTVIIVKRNGMNRIYAADLVVYLDSGEVSGVTFKKEPEGIFYPIDQIDPKELFLKGFTWNPALRPKKWQELLKKEEVVEVPKEESVVPTSPK